MAYKTLPGESQHAARERIARAKGFGSYRSYRQASGQVRERATRGLASRDRSYARTVNQSTASIRKRASSKVRTPRGTVLTSTDTRRQYAHVRGAHRQRGEVDVSVYAVVLMNSLDRRRRAGRGRRGRDTGYRTVRLTTTSTDLAADDTGDAGAFADALEAEIDVALAQLYGGAGASWSYDRLAVTV